MKSAEILLHPVRMRIWQAFLGDRALTVSDLRAELTDVPSASLYRQVGVLVDNGVLVSNTTVDVAVITSTLPAMSVA